MDDGVTSEQALRAELAERRRVEADLRRAIEHEKMLAREFNHRLRNKLAIVQAIVDSAARYSTTVDEYRSAVSDRIGSLARTNALLVEQNSEEMPLEKILRSEFDAYCSAGDDRFVMSGPSVWIPAPKVTPLAMAIHELSANAVKYGALSAPGGCVHLHWDTVAEDDGPVLVINWTEKAGPRVAPPTREGFGSLLLKRLLRSRESGSVELDFAPDGLRAEIRLPLASSEDEVLNGQRVA